MIGIGKQLARFAADSRGATAIEYSIVAAGIACAIAATLTLTGTSLLNLWTTVQNALG
jgi:pilus assembly protein Flp/PilA